MKKILFLCLAVAAMASCEKAEITTTDVTGAVGKVATLSVNAETYVDGETRAVPDFQTDDTRYATYYLEVHRVLSDESTSLYYRPEENTTGVFTLQLATGCDYILLGWVDYEKYSSGTDNYYITDDLTNVYYNTSGANATPFATPNDGNRDAFAGKMSIENFSGNISQTFKLTRPFARVNVYANDFTDIPDDDLKPDLVNISYEGIYTTYNIMTGEPSNYVAYDNDGIMSYTIYAQSIQQHACYYGVEGIEEGDLTTDYLFVGDDGAIVNFTQTYYNSSLDSWWENPVSEYTFSNIPIGKNYQTTVSGNIFSASNSVTFDFDKSWDDTATE